MNTSINTKTKTKTTIKREPKTSKSISLPSKLTEVESESPPSVIFEHVKQLHNIRRYTNRRKKKQKISRATKMLWDQQPQRFYKLWGP